MPEFKDDVNVVLQTINKNLRHQDYAHVIEIAKKYTTFATGYGITEHLKRFNGRESIEMFTQRVNLTIVNTMDIHNSCVQPLYKACRTPANISMTWTGKDAKQTADNKKIITKIADNFWGQQSVKKYLDKRIPDMDKTDPNSFFVVEWKEQAKPTNGVKVEKPYPFEVNSIEAINYTYKDNILQWFIVRHDLIIYDDKGLPHEGEIIYSYLENHNTKATQIHYKALDAWKQQNPIHIEIDKNMDLGDLVEGQLYLYGTDGENPASRRWYQFQVFKHNLGFVPAKRFGTKTDPITRDRTCVPMIDAARSYLEDSIQTMSEFMITKRCHVFPQKFTYLPKCEGENEVLTCYKGQVPGGGACKVCNGTGTIAHTSSQDMIGIRMPDDLKDMVSLENFMVYKGPPIDLITFQKEYGFESLKRYANGAVYNGNNFAKNKVVKTATEVELDLDSVYDTLKPFAEHYSECTAFVYQCIAGLRDMDKGFEYTHQFPNDFGMEPLDYLLATLGQANTSGAPAHVKKALNVKIQKKIYVDQPREITKLETQDKFNPFSGKTESEIAYILANNLTTKFNRILYANFTHIFNEIEFEFASKNVDFYELTEVNQRNAVKVKVNTFIALMDAEDAADAAGAFGATEQQDPQQVEAQAKANLKGSVGGIQGLLEIQTNVSSGITDRTAALKLISLIYGIEGTDAEELLGVPKPAPKPQPSLN